MKKYLFILPALCLIAGCGFFNTLDELCGIGSFGLNAAAMDTRIKGSVIVTMYDMTRVSAKGYNDTMSAEELYKMREQLNNQRTKDTQTKTFAHSQGLPDKADDNAP